MTDFNKFFSCLKNPSHAIKFCGGFICPDNFLIIPHSIFSNFLTWACMVLHLFQIHACKKQKKCKQFCQIQQFTGEALQNLGAVRKKHSAQGELNIGGLKGFHQEHLLFCGFSRGCVPIPLISVKQLGYCCRKSEAKPRDGDG